MKNSQKSKNSTITKQFTFAYLTALVLPILIIGVLLLIGVNSMLRQYNQELINADNQRVHSLLFEITTQAYSISEDISQDVSVKQLLKGDFTSKDDFRNAAIDCSILTSFADRYTQLESIAIYTDHPCAVDCNHLYRTTPEVEASDWYQKALSQSMAFWTILTDVDSYGNSYSYLSIIRKLPVLYSDYNAILVIRLSDNYLKARISTTDYQSLLSLNDGNIFFASDRSLYGEKPPYFIDYSDPYYQAVGLFTISNKNILASISSFSLFQSDSTVYVCVYSPDAYNSISSISWFYVAIIIIAIIIPGSLLFLYIHHFSERVNILRNRMHKATNEDYTTSFSFSGNDELSDVYTDLDILIKNIREKEAAIYTAEIKQQELINNQQAMEYKMLASQINPHFLYNTLETIRMKALKAGNKEVSDAIKLLGKSMRYVLENTGSSSASLENELEYVKMYLNIQQLRFEDRVNYNIYVDNDIDTSHYSILPLLLQPIVENAITHGLEGIYENGLIEIFIKSLNEETFIITVTDNGNGLDEETLSDIRTKLETPHLNLKSSIGLYNIHQRIRLFYGENYGLTIESTKGSGTKVSITFPKMNY